MNDPCCAVRRKVRAIAEVRYPAVAAIFDIRGRLIREIHPIIGDHFPRWETDPGGVHFSDDLSKPTREFVISLKRTAVIIEDPDSVQEFVDETKKYLGLMYGQVGKDIGLVSRVGVRLTEICSPQDARTHGDVIDRVTEGFVRIPDDLTVGLMGASLRVTHESGYFYVGSVKQGDPWVQQAFRDPGQNVPEFGIALDIDSYANDLEVGSADHLIKAFEAVFMVTKSVEEGLLRHQGMLNW